MIRVRIQLLPLLLLLAPLAPPASMPAHALTPAWSLEGEAVARHLGEYQATAGDVNNDGYSDVLIGEPNYANGQATEGRARLFLGGPDGLATTPAWEVEANVTSYAFGRCVAPAGDLNADGFGDWLVGATGYDNGQNNEGAVYVYLGGAGALGTTPAAILEGNTGSTLFGHAAGTAGDVNGDGFADIVVGAYIYTNGQNQEGRAYLFLGNAGGVATTPAWTFEADQTGANLGFSVSTAGDVNGDGFCDVVVGAYRYDGTVADDGRVFVFHGNAAPGLSLAPSFQLGAGQSGAAFGFSVSTAGDLNGDGYADLVVGTRNYGVGQGSEGAYQVLLGGAAGASVTNSTLVESNPASARLGESVSTAGDVNGDGFADIVVGAPAYSGNGVTGGGVFVRYGSGSSATGLAVQADTLSAGVASANFGLAVASAGDVNGDGFTDLLVGSNNYTNGQSTEGRVQLFLGQATLPRNNFTTGTPMFSGADEIRLAPAGDMNGDGKADLAIGVADWLSGGNADAGEVHVWQTFPTATNTKLVGGAGPGEKL
ncbi:MAG: FG-GAP repeat protein, partial [Caulobacteraceae bacterium]|nr:FG-GAP repeat protein [Caulobacteraceae bacterium]